MKRIVSAIAVAIVMLTCSMNANAQFSNVRFGVLGGFTSSSTNIKNLETKSVSLYHAGATLKVPLVLGFAIQPSIMYQVKGVSLEQVSEGTIGDALGSLETKVGFVEIPVQVQWGPDLIAFRPYVFAEPFVGFRVNQNSELKSSLGNLTGGDKVKEVLDNNLKKMEYGLSLGAGIEFWRFQLSAKYFWNFGQLYGEDESFKEVIQKFPDEAEKAFSEGKSFNGLSFTLAFLF